MVLGSTARQTLNTNWATAGRAAILDALSDVVAVLDSDGLVMFVNEAVRGLLGIEPSSCVGRDVIELVDPVDQERATRSWAATMASAGPKEPMMVRVRTGTGAQLAVEVVANNRLDDPAIDGVVLVIRDVSDREAASIALRQAQEGFRSGFEMSLVGAAILDRDGRYQAVNQTFCRITGRTESELLGLRPGDITHPDDAERDRENIARLFAGEIDYFEVEKRYLRKDGSVVWAALHGAVVSDATGTQQYLLGQIEDLSRQRAAETEALHSAARLDLLAAALPVGIYWSDPDGNTLYSNDRWREIYRLDADQALGRGWISAIHPEDAERAIAEIVRSAAGQLPFECEFRVGTADDELRWVRANVVAVTDGGTTTGYVGSVEDVTARVEADGLLVEATMRFRRAFENAPIGMALVAPDGSWLEVNNSLVQLLGYGSEELMGKTFQDVTHSDDLDTDLGFLAQVLNHEIDGYAMEKRYFHADGHIVWVNLSVSLVDGPDGAPRYFISQIEDISERKRAEHELTRYADRLARSNGELAEFASVAAHDLAEPLRVIEGYLHVLRSRCGDQLDDNALTFIGHAMSGADRLQQLIDDLLEYSRVDGSGPEADDCSIELAVTQAQRFLATKIAERDAAISLGDLPAVHGDEMQLAQLFQNLISNAITFTPADRSPRIAITASRSGDAWRITVSDNGIGIPSEHRERVFGMFKRLHGRDEYPGTGIGLAICKKIVERHGGTIWIDDGGGATGTAVHIVLPGPSSDPERRS